MPTTTVTTPIHEDLKTESAFQQFQLFQRKLRGRPGLPKSFLVGPKPPRSVCVERSQSGNDSSASRQLNHRRKRSESARGVQPRPEPLSSPVNRRGGGPSVTCDTRKHTSGGGAPYLVILLRAASSVVALTEGGAVELRLRTCDDGTKT